MSKSKSLLSISFFTMTLTILFFSIAATEQPTFYRSINPTSLGLHKEQLSTHLHFYLHDISTNHTKSSVTVATSPITNNTLLFGELDVADYPLTVGFDPDSMLLGKAVGISALAVSKAESLTLTVLNLAFTVGKFNGSTLYLLGRETKYSVTTARTAREVPVIGGTGAFRFASGFAHVKPPVYSVNVSSPGLDAVEEYDLYVCHY